MKKIIVLILLLSFSITSFAQIQDSEITKHNKTDSLLLTFIYLESGDIYIGHIISESDTVLVIVEKNLGVISLQAAEIKKIENIFRNSSIQLFLSDNSIYTGKLLDVEKENYILENLHTGVVRIPINMINKITSLEEKRLVSHNPNSTRYFFAPSAIPLEKNGGYYQNAYLLSNSVNFGLTPNFSMGGGVIIPLLFFITPKVGYKIRKNIYVGAGLIAATTLIPEATISGGIPFGLITIGNTENNFTIGSGYGLLWADEDFEQTHYPISTINGMVRISKRIQLVSENWIIPFKRHMEEEGYFDNNGYWVDDIELEEMETKLYMALSLGLRIMVGERSSVDFTPVYLYGGNDGVVVPYLDYVYKF